MTTPERLRRRQRIESAGIAILALALVLVFIYFRGQDSAQEKCLSTFLQRDSEVGATRSKIVEEESRATRRIITKALTAETREDIIRARAAYFRSLKAIDRAREANPVRPFPEGVCD